MVLVRQRFWGRALADGLVDLPFAVSPIIAGLMLVIVYGPNGWLGRCLESAGFRVVYAWPGMVLATMFVTAPVRRPRGRAGPPRVRRRPGRGRLDPRRRPLADLLAGHAPLDPLGPGLRRDPDRGPLARRVRRPARRLGQHPRPDPDGHPLHPRRRSRASTPKAPTPRASSWPAISFVLLIGMEAGPRSGSTRRTEMAARVSARRMRSRVRGRASALSLTR